MKSEDITRVVCTSISHCECGCDARALLLFIDTIGQLEIGVLGPQTPERADKILATARELFRLCYGADRVRFEPHPVKGWT